MNSLLHNNANTFEPTDYDKFKEIVENGFAHALSGNVECEDNINEDTQTTIRCIPTEQPDSEGVCIVCSTESKELTIFARPINIICLNTRLPS